MYSSLCQHIRKFRVNKDLIKCHDCGESFVNQADETRNDRLKKYAEENTFFDNSFNHNFDNRFVTNREWDKIYSRDRQEMEMKAYGSEILPGYTTYISKDNRTEILVDGQPMNQSGNHGYAEVYKYKVRINDKWYNLTHQQIKTLLNRFEATIF